MILAMGGKKFDRQGGPACGLKDRRGVSLTGERAVIAKGSEESSRRNHKPVALIYKLGHDQEGEINYDSTIEKS